LAACFFSDATARAERRTVASALSRKTPPTPTKGETVSTQGVDLSAAHPSRSSRPVGVEQPAAGPFGDAASPAETPSWEPRLLAGGVGPEPSSQLAPPKTAPIGALTAQRMLPSLTALQAFERSAAHLSFRRAAFDLSLSPSAVSHQIRNLEDHFGVRLFAREGRAVRLTREGAHYLDSVSRSLALLREASRGLMHQGRGGRRDVRVSALPFVMSTALIPSLKEFETRYPDFSLRIEATHDYADFDHADIDVAIRYGREQSAGLRLEPLIEVRGLPVCAPAVAAGGVAEARDLADHVLIHMTHQPRAWSAWLRAPAAPTCSRVDSSGSTACRPPSTRPNTASASRWRRTR
jgi:LysR family glycine cleavage system transcriptional activator